MKNLTRQHCAKVLVEWSEYYLNRARADLKRAQDNLAEEKIQLRIAKAVDEDRKARENGDWGGGFGPPTPEQLFAETLKRLEADMTEKSRIVDNNEDVLLYIKDLVAKDLSS